MEEKLLGLVFTNRCTANCRHCSIRDGATIQTDMPIENAFRYVDDFAAYNNSTESLTLGFSGGEPFLRIEEMLEVAKYAKKRGYRKISCVTNGYWGENKKNAREKVDRLIHAGVNSIAFSIDDFHLDYIPLRSILSAFSLCREAGIRLGVKCVVTKRTRRIHQILESMKNQLLGQSVVIDEIPYVPTKFGNIPEEEWLITRETFHEPCRAVGAVLLIMPNGDVYPCCGSGWSEGLLTGNTGSTNIKTLFRSVQKGALYQILNECGPGHLKEYFERFGKSSYGFNRGINRNRN